MSGWGFAILIALVTGLGLILVARPGRGVWELILAALFIGIAGYAWQGSPALIGQPREGANKHKPFDEDLAIQRRAMADRYGEARQWMVLSDGFARAGDTQEAANVLTAGLKQFPDDANLWLGLGNALVAHADERLSPAAEYAYQQAMRLDPTGPGPRYFYGLALAKSGQYAPAKQLWTELLQQTPPQASWRDDLEGNLQMLDRAMAMPGSGPVTQ